MTNSKVLKKRYKSKKISKRSKRSKRRRGGSSIKRTNIHDIEMVSGEKILLDLIKEKKVLEQNIIDQEKKISDYKEKINEFKVNEDDDDIETPYLSDLRLTLVSLKAKLRIVNTKIDNLHKRPKISKLSKKNVSKIEKYMRDKGEDGDIDKKFQEYRDSWNKLSKEDRKKIRKDYNKYNPGNESYFKKDGSFIDRESQRQYEIDVMLDWLRSVESRADPARQLGEPSYHKKTPLVRQNAVRRDFFEQPRF